MAEAEEAKAAQRSQRSASSRVTDDVRAEVRMCVERLAGHHFAHANMQGKQRVAVDPAARDATLLSVVGQVLRKPLL